MNRYTIHYRSTGYADETALIVTDATGKAYLFSAGELQAACAGGGGRGATRLAALLRRRAAWVRVMPAKRYTLDHLRRLAGRTATPCRATHPPRPLAPGGGRPAPGRDCERPAGRVGGR